MNPRDALPGSTRVGEFELIRVLGQGGFGIVYEAHEPTLDRKVALKEYFPAGVAHRDGLDVGCGEGEALELFNAGLARFVREARLLAMLNERAKHTSSLVAVYRVFQAHGTAYMAMKLYEGKTLRQTVAGQTGPVSEPWLIGVLLRLLDALEALHSLAGERLVHRDVSPDNIILEPDGNPVLLDFGATRKVDDAQTSMIYKPGYSPLEQYTEAQPLGPWTDLYALCATAYFAIARRSPTPAIDRYAGVPAPGAGELGANRFTAEFLAIVDRGMEILPGMRWQSAAELRTALSSLPSWRLAYAGTVTPNGAGVLDSPLTTPPMAPTATAAWLRLLADPTRATDNDATRAMPSAVQASAAPAIAMAAAPPPAAAPEAMADPTPSMGRPPPRPTRSSARLRWGGLAAAAASLLAALALWSGMRGGLPGPSSPAAVVPSGAGAPPPATAQTPAPALVVNGTIETNAINGTKGSNRAEGAEGAEGAGPLLSCTGPSDGWSCVLSSLQAMGSASAALTIRPANPEVAVNDPIGLSLAFSQRGRVRVYAVDDHPDASMRMIFPNPLDRDDQVGPKAPLVLPRGPHWKLLAQPPRGRMWLVAVLLPDHSPAPELGMTASVETLRNGLADGQAIRWLGGSGCVRPGVACAMGVGVQFAGIVVR